MKIVSLATLIPPGVLRDTLATPSCQATIVDRVSAMEILT